MALVELKTDPSPKDLRWFAALWFPLFCGVIGYTAWQKFGQAEGAFVAGAFALMVAAVGLVAPRLVRPLFVGLVYLTFPIGLVVSYVMMLVVFYGMFTPLGLILRLLRDDPMTRAIDKSAESYWQEFPKEEKTIASYFRQY